MIPAVCFAFHFIYNAWGVERPANLLWMCHVTAFLLAVGLIGSFAGLVRLVAPWTLLGLPIWLVDAVVLGTTTRISVLSHILVPLTAIVAMSQVGGGRSPIKEAVKAFAFYIALVGLSRLVTPPDFNVNLAYRIYPFFGADVVSSYSAYFFITGVAIFVCLLGLSVLFKRRFPPLSLDALAAAAESGRDVAVNEDGSIAEVKAPRPRPPPPKKSFNTIRGAAVDPRTIQSLDEELPVEDPMTSSTREEPGRPAWLFAGA